MTTLVLMCAGGAIASIMLWFLHSRSPSSRCIVAVNSGVCALLAALTADLHHHLELAPLVYGLLSTAAPLTSVLVPQPMIGTVPEAIRLAGRLSVLVALNLLYCTTFAMVGFLSVVATLPS